MNAELGIEYEGNWRFGCKEGKGRSIKNTKKADGAGSQIIISGNWLKNIIHGHAELKETTWKKNKV